MNETKRQIILRRWTALKNERQSWIDHWRDLSEQIRPRGSRFFTDERNKGWKVNQHIINTTPTFSARTLASGMMSGITSPSRPWFRLKTNDVKLDETDAVKRYLVAVEDELRSTFLRSNFYDSLHTIYSDLVVHGTAALHIDDDPDRSIRCYVYPVGQFALGLSEKNEVDTVFRELSMTVLQVVKKFGAEKCSQSVQNLYREKQYDKWVQCVHAIYPNEEYQEGRLGQAGKPFLSDWMELGGDESKMLRESGYEEFPCMVPRWNVTGEDVYGTSPAMEVLGDCRALQFLEKRKAKIVDKMSDPPMSAPTEMRAMQASLLPGSMNFVPPGSKFEPAYAPRADSIVVVGQEIQRHEQRIRQGFYADLWLMLSESEGTMTAREVSERREEKLLQLGTVLQRVSNDLLDPAVSRTINILARSGRLPETPRELVGREFKVEYMNIMAQAQKLLGTTGMERLSAFTVNLSNAKPEVLDKLDFDQTIDEYSDALGVPPTTVRPDDEVAKIRLSRSKAQAAQVQMEQVQQASEAAQKLGAAPMNAENPNALTELLRGVGAR